MQCTRCKYFGSRVIDTNKDEGRNLVTRRRECIKCGNRYTTQEAYRTSNFKNTPTNIKIHKQVIK